MNTASNSTTQVTILYNPNSTGDGKIYATKLKDDLANADTDGKFDVKIQATEHAGHAEEIATAHAKSGKHCILISASGDGGYHELVNGALSHNNSQVIVGLLPAGNANDHYNAVHKDDSALAENIMHETYSTIDLLHVSATVDGKPWTRYAHSYAGVGVVARAAKNLTKKRPNLISEKWLVAHSLLSFRYVKLREKGKTRRYSSLVWSNIAIMSKILKLADNASLTDGKFEINRIRFRSKFRLVLYLLTAATIGLKPSESISQAIFSVTEPTEIQLDGEVYTLDAGCKVTITSEQKKLRYVC